MSFWTETISNWWTLTCIVGLVTVVAPPLLLMMYGLATEHGPRLGQLVLEIRYHPAFRYIILTLAALTALFIIATGYTACVHLYRWWFNDYPVPIDLESFNPRWTPRN